jgi:HPt (histidine-containing phosphotransfer) domain-containing protein
MPASAPNERLAGLVAALGKDDASELVALYLDAFGRLVAEIASGDSARAERAAHSLKSSSQQMGLPGLARDLAALEEKLGRAGEVVTQAEIESLKAGFAAAEGPLRAFVRQQTGSGPDTPTAKGLIH